MALGATLLTGAWNQGRLPWPTCAGSAAGNRPRAVEILAGLAEAHPDWARAQLELGIALGCAGRGEDAVAALRRALALKPDLPQAWLALADHLTATGDGAGADAAYAQHIKFSTRAPETGADRCRCHPHAGRDRRAARAARFAQCATLVCGNEPYTVTAQPRTFGIRFSQNF